MVVVFFGLPVGWPWLHFLGSTSHLLKLESSHFCRSFSAAVSPLQEFRPAIPNNQSSLHIQGLCSKVAHFDFPLVNPCEVPLYAPQKNL